MVEKPKQKNVSAPKRLLLKGPQEWKKFISTIDSEPIVSNGLFERGSVRNDSSNNEKKLAIYEESFEKRESGIETKQSGILDFSKIKPEQIHELTGQTLYDYLKYYGKNSSNQDVIPEKIKQNYYQGSEGNFKKNTYDNILKNIYTIYEEAFLFKDSKKLENFFEISSLNDNLNAFFFNWKSFINKEGINKNADLSQLYLNDISFHPLGDSQLQELHALWNNRSEKHNNSFSGTNKYLSRVSDSTHRNETKDKQTKIGQTDPFLDACAKKENMLFENLLKNKIDSYQNNFFKESGTKNSLESAIQIVFNFFLKESIEKIPNIKDFFEAQNSSVLEKNNEVNILEKLDLASINQNETSKDKKNFFPQEIETLSENSKDQSIYTGDKKEQLQQLRYPVLENYNFKPSLFKEKSLIPILLGPSGSVYFRKKGIRCIAEIVSASIDGIVFRTMTPPKIRSEYCMVIDFLGMGCPSECIVLIKKRQRIAISNKINKLVLVWGDFVNLPPVYKSMLGDYLSQFC